LRFIPRFTVEMTVHDLLYLSYFVPIPRVLHLVPDLLSLEPVREDLACVSVVTFHSKHVRLHGFPAFRFNYDQINLRTYVHDPITDQRGVLFLRSGITSGLIAQVARLMGIPWDSVQFQVKTAPWPEKPGLLYTAAGYWGQCTADTVIEVEADSAQGPMSRAPQAWQEMAGFITEPRVGFYAPSGRIIRFEVRHAPVVPLQGRARRVHIPSLTSSGILTEEELKSPDSILLASEAQFSVFLPPRSLNRRIHKVSPRNPTSR
jgi:hypothetical protein